MLKSLLLISQIFCEDVKLIMTKEPVEVIEVPDKQIISFNKTNNGVQYTLYDENTGRWSQPAAVNTSGISSSSQMAGISNGQAGTSQPGSTSSFEGTAAGAVGSSSQNSGNGTSSSNGKKDKSGKNGKNSKKNKDDDNNKSSTSSSSRRKNNGSRLMSMSSLLLVCLAATCT